MLLFTSWETFVSWSSCSRISPLAGGFWRARSHQHSTQSPWAEQLPPRPWSPRQPLGELFLPPHLPSGTREAPHAQFCFRHREGEWRGADMPGGSAAAGDGEAAGEGAEAQAGLTMPPSDGSIPARPRAAPPIPALHATSPPPAEGCTHTLGLALPHPPHPPEQGVASQDPPQRQVLCPRPPPGPPGCPQQAWTLDAPCFPDPSRWHTSLGIWLGGPAFLDKHCQWVLR